MKHIVHALLFAAGCCVLHADDSLRPHTLAGFGSSVCNGAGAPAGEGYIHHVQRRLATDGWTVLNVSRGGDNTVKIQRRWDIERINGMPVTNQPGPILFTNHAAHVLIGLSLANEGFNDTQFKSNLPHLIHVCHTKGMTVALGNCYANGHMTSENYAKTLLANLFIGQLKEPSFNFLGAVDDGTGRWCRGLWNDPGHPNASGHREMYHAIVPTLWRALEQGKPAPTREKESEGMNASGRLLSVTAQDPIHSFAQVFWFKPGSNGAIARTQVLPTTIHDLPMDGTNTERVIREFLPDAQPVDITLRAIEGQMIYTGLQGRQLAAPVSNDWNMVVLSHAFARGRTELYVNGHLAGALDERMAPRRFTLGGGPVRDWMIYRSTLYPDAVELLQNGGMFRSSLEFFATLREGDTANRAQSLTACLEEHIKD